MKNLRIELIKFCQRMEKVLTVHDKEKGNSYKTCDIEFLIEKLEEEYNEVENIFINKRYYNNDIEKENLCNELIDLANVSMMLWNRFNKK